MRLLLDEMDSPALTSALRAGGVETDSVIELGLGGTPDPAIFAFVIDGGYVLLTENVGDFTRIAAEHITAGRHHPGVSIALSSRFSRRAAGVPALVRAVTAIGAEPLADRVMFLERAE